MEDNIEKGILTIIFNSRLEEISNAIESEEILNEDSKKEELV